MEKLTRIDNVLLGVYQSIADRANVIIIAHALIIVEMALQVYRYTSGMDGMFIFVAGISLTIFIYSWLISIYQDIKEGAANPIRNILILARILIAGSALILLSRLPFTLNPIYAISFFDHLLDISILYLLSTEKNPPKSKSRIVYG